MSVLGQLREAVGRLNPAEVREAAERPLAIRLRAGSEAGYDALFRFLLPESMSLERRRRAASLIYLDGEPNRPAKFDISIVERGQVALPNDFIWERGKETTLVREILDRKDAPDLALARWFPAFREEATRRIVNRISVENAMFSVATAIPNIAPYIGLVWTPAEFASDTAFLTLNQIRMIFSLAAASDRAVGYGEQKPEIASIVTGAFGWRAVARELVGKIPIGGGIVPKAAIAFAGTWVVGASVERFYRIGYGFTRAERKAAYSDAFDRGKDIARGVVQRFRKAG